MTERFASAAQQMQLERRIRAVAFEAGQSAAWITLAAILMGGQRSALGLGASTAILAIGASGDVVVAWPPNADGTDRFQDPNQPDGVSLDYEVDIVPTGLLNKGNVAVVTQTTSTVTVRITATVLLGIGTQFIVYGRTPLA